MKNLNTYIIEKFKINKGTLSNSHLFSKGDPIYRVCYYENVGYKTYKILLGCNNSEELFYFTEIKNDKIYFINNDSEHKEVCFESESNVRINSNGFYETDSGEKARVVYLNYRDAIHLLEDIFYLDFAKNASKLKDYFDKDDDIPYERLEIFDKPIYINKCLNVFKKYKQKHEKS